MWVTVKNRRCKKCGVVGGIFFAQKQRITQISINNICKICKSVERSEYYYKHDKMKRYLDWNKEIESR